MYIPEFWCGVIATTAFEILALIGYGIYLDCKKKGKDDETT